jgi:hypothetical protein
MGSHSGTNTDGAAQNSTGLPQLDLRFLHLVQKRVKLRQRQLHGHCFSRPGAVHNKLELQKHLAHLRNLVIGRSHCERIKFRARQGTGEMKELTKYNKLVKRNRKNNKPPKRHSMSTSWLTLRVFSIIDSESCTNLPPNRSARYWARRESMPAI